jgi:hypothetical protein
MTLNDLLTLYCEQQEATGYNIDYDHQRNKDGEYPVNKVTVSIYWNGEWHQIRDSESIDFNSEAEAISQLQILTQLNKAIA